MYNTKYILGFTNDLNELYEIYFDFLNYVGAITQLSGSDDVLTIRSTTGDENKLEPILGTEALINIFVDENSPITIADLIAQHDNDIRVTIYRDEDYSKAIYQGFIVVEDNSQPFLDPPYILSVRALDGLGLLKKVDLVDTNNLLFVGLYSVVEWIAQILNKTGQTLNLRIYFNFWESTFAFNIGALEQVFLNAITFSQGDAFNVNSADPTVDLNASAADDCYTALEKIARCFRCKLFQEDGRWCLVSLYEYLNHDGFSFKEYSFGDPVAGIIPVTVIDTGTNKDYSAPIGKDQIIHPFVEDQVLYLKLATKWIKLTYVYDQSLNKICNQALTEGDRNATYDGTIPNTYTKNPPTTLPRLGYDAYCWGHFNGGFGSPIAPTQPGFIGVVEDALNYEADRFLVLKEAGVLTYFRSTEVLVDSGDKLEISLSVRTLVDRGPQSLAAVAYVLFYGDDGTHWTLYSNDNSPVANPTHWVLSNSSFTSSVQFIGHQFLTQTNQFEQVNIPSPLPSVPGSGKIVLILPASLTGAQETWFKDITLTLHPFLNGSYAELKGDYNYSASNNLIKQTLSEDVQISDSPKRYFKGALLKPDGLSLATPTWGRVPLENFRFTEMMERIMYNHLYRIVQKIEGTFRGLVYIPADDPTIIRPNGYLNSYAFVDGDEPTKRFMLTSFEKNYGTGQWRGVFVETLADQNADGFIFPDNYKFSYIFQ